MDANVGDLQQGSTTGTQVTQLVAICSNAANYTFFSPLILSPADSKNGFLFLQKAGLQLKTPVAGNKCKLVVVNGGPVKRQVRCSSHSFQDSMCLQPRLPLRLSDCLLSIEKVEKVDRTLITIMTAEYPMSLLYHPLLKLQKYPRPQIPKRSAVALQIHNVFVSNNAFTAPL